MRSGDVIFVRGTSLISRLILFFDKGNFSHVAIAVSDNEVIETNWNMKSKIVKFHYTDYEVVLTSLTGVQRKYIPIVARGYEGRLYDYIQVIGLIFRSRLNSPRQLICSELVYNILTEVGYLNNESLKDVTPNELYIVLTKSH